MAIENLAHGFASLNAGTSGGSGGRTVTVSTGAQLQAAIDSVTSPTDRLVINVAGTITPGNSGADVIEIAGRNNISIIGSGTKGELNGIGIRVSDGSSNLIIQNLKIHDVATGPKDAIGIEGPSRNIWIDGNDLSSSMDVSKDYYDGLLDIKRGAQYITVSNNHFHDHHKASLIGYSDADDSVRYVTYNNNIFEDVGSRTPSVRFSDAHIYNNYYKDVGTSGINLRMDAVGLIENNFFENVRNPIVGIDSSEPGTWELSGNVMQNVSWGSVGSGEASAADGRSTGSYDAPYSYSLLSATDAKAVNLANAGIGSLGNGSPAPSTPAPAPVLEVPAPMAPQAPTAPEAPPAPAPDATGTKVGTDSNDVLGGTKGADSIEGLEGHDRISGGEGDDHLSGGLGRDQLSAGEGNDVLSGDAGADELEGGDGNDKLNGGEGQDKLFAGEGDDLLDGGSSGDTMVGGAGNDTYVINIDGDDVIELATEGFDTVLSPRSYALGNHVEKLVLTEASDVNGTGDKLDNVIIGNEGKNEINGGLGDDILTGAAGRDQFIFDKDGGGKDRITDFVLGQDTLVFNDIDVSDIKLQSSESGATVGTPDGEVFLQGVHLTSISSDWALFG